MDETLDDLIAREERSIECLEAELCIERSRLAKAIREHEHSKKDATLTTSGRVAMAVKMADAAAVNPSYAPLDWILEAAPHSLLQDNPPFLSPQDLDHHAHTVRVHWMLQSVMRKFCFTSVTRGKRLQKANIATEEYNLEGVFFANRSVAARIRIVLENAAAPNGVGSVQKVQCQLVPSDKQQLDENKVPPSSENDWSWLQKQVDRVVRETQCTTANYLTFFITSVSEYLDFDARRQRLLSKSNLERRASASSLSSCSCVCWKHLQVRHDCHTTMLRIHIARRRRENGNHVNLKSAAGEVLESVPTFHIAWVWQWKERRDYLRIVKDPAMSTLSATTSSVPQFQQFDVGQLLAAVFHNDCWATIQFLMAHCSGCAFCRTKGSGSDDTGNNAAASTGIASAGIDRNKRRASPGQTPSARPKVPGRRRRDVHNAENGLPLLAQWTVADATEHDASDEEENTDVDDEQENGNDNGNAAGKEDTDEEYNEDETDSDGDEDRDATPLKRRKRSRAELNDSEDDAFIGTAQGTSTKDDGPHSPFRLSPSGRRRSDYEVQRCLRIQRNESKLTQLGLHLPIDAAWDSTIGNKSFLSAKTRPDKPTARQLRQVATGTQTRTMLSPRLGAMTTTTNKPELPLPKDVPNDTSERDAGDGQERPEQQASTESPSPEKQRTTSTSVPSISKPPPASQQVTQAESAAKSTSIGDCATPKLYARPRGRPRSGCVWNPSIGAWEKT